MSNVGGCLINFSPDARLQGNCSALEDHHISPGEDHLVVHCVNFRAYLVRDYRCDRDDRSLHPHNGVECSSLGYVVYGGVAIVTVFLTVISTIFVRNSETRVEKSTIVRDFTACIAVSLYGISVLLAVADAT